MYGRPGDDFICPRLLGNSVLPTTNCKLRQGSPLQAVLSDENIRIVIVLVLARRLVASSLSEGNYSK